MDERHVDKLTMYEALVRDFRMCRYMWLASRPQRGDVARTAVMSFSLSRAAPRCRRHSGLAFSS